jgi:tRNA-specific 2-thiouridylase
MKALVAMSGGVDSSVAAWLLKQSGCELVGVTLKLFDGSVCCSVDDALDARKVADRLNIPFYLFNFKQDFESEVIDRFAEGYKKGLTPSPCIDCNRYIKFEKLLERASSLEFDYMATGHYARIEKDGERCLLKTGADPLKDQSYFLYMLKQSQLARTLFPVGGLAKAEVREIALAAGLANAKKKESQNICFVTDGKYADFIEERLGKKFGKGDIVNKDGKILGKHNGFIRYTIGQRRGLGVSSAYPLYVCRVEPSANAVVVGRNADLFSKTVTIKDINLIPFTAFEKTARVTAKVRYRQKAETATVRQTEEDTLVLEFDSPQRAVAKGQAAVLYDGEIVLGGGTIV